MKSCWKSAASRQTPRCRLARYFGTTAEMWAALQADYDLRLARYEKERQIERDVEPLSALQPAAA